MGEVFDLYGKLLLDDEEFVEGLQNATNTAEQAGKKSGGFFGTAFKVAGAAIAAASAAVVKFSSDAVKTGADFDKSMSQVAATLGVTTDEIGELRDFAMEMGATTAFSAIQAADALNYMALAGYNTEESMEMLPTVLNLAASGNMDLARASDMVTDAQTALGLSFEDTAKMVDQMAKTASTTNTSVEQLGEAFLTIGGTAQYMFSDMENGITITDELSKVLGVLADNGIKGSEAGTHLRNMILKLSAPTSEGAALLAQYGEILGHDLAFDEATGQMRQFEDIFADLNQVLGDATDEEKLQAFSTLFNARDIAAANALLGTTAERWEEVGAAIGSAEGSAEQMAKTQLDNLAGDITLFKSALEGAKIVLSDQLTPSIREFVQFGTEGIQDLTMAFQEGGLEGFFSTLGEVISRAVTIITTKLPEIVSAGAALLSSLVTGIIENLPLILETVGMILVQLVEGLIEGLPILLDAITGLMQSISDMILAGLPTFQQTISSLVESLVTFFTTNVPQFIEIATQIILALAQGLISALPNLLASAGEIINAIIQNLTTNIPVLLKMGVELISGLANGFIQNLPAIVSAITEIINAVVDFLLGDGLMDMLIMGVELIMSLAEGLIDALPDIIEAMMQILLALVTAILQDLPTFVQKGIELVVALITGLMDALPDIIQAIIDILTTLIEYIINNLPMFLEAGVQIIVSLAQALIDNAPQVLEALLSLIESLITLIIDNLGEFVSQGLEILIAIGKGIVQAVPELLAKAGEAIKGLWEAFVNTDWGEVGGNIIDGITSGIGGAVSRLWNAAVNAAKTALQKIKNVLGISSPSKVFRDEVGKWIPEGMAIGIEANTDAVESAMDDLATLTTDPFMDMGNVIPFNDSASGTIGGRSIVINVYPREGQDEESIAEYVMEKLNLEYQREERALA